MRIGVVCLHGFLGSSADWTAVREAFFSIYSDGAVSFHALDLPGHGELSGCDDACFSWEWAVDYVRAESESLACDRLILVGYSMGGRLALAVGSQLDDLFSDVILVSANPGLEEASDREARLEVDELRAQRLSEQGLKGFLDEWYEMLLFRPLKEMDEFDQMFERRLSGDPVGLARALKCFSVARQTNYWDCIEGFSFNLISVYGELDVVYKGISERLVREFGVRSIGASSVGHCVPLEAPECVASVILEAVVA